MRRRTATPKKLDETPEKSTRRSRRGRARTPEEVEEEMEQQDVDNAETVDNTAIQVATESEEEQPKKRGRRSARASSTDSNSGTRSRRGRPKRDAAVAETIEEEPIQQPPKETTIEEKEQTIQKETIVSNGEENSRDVEIENVNESNDVSENSYPEPESMKASEPEPTVAEDSNEVPEQEAESMQYTEIIPDQAHEKHSTPDINNGDESVDAPDADLIEIRKSPDDTIQDESMNIQGQEDCEDGEIIEDPPKPASPEPVQKRQRRKFITHFASKSDAKDENAETTKTVSNKWSSDDSGRLNTESNEIKSPRKKDDSKTTSEDTNHKEESVQKPPFQRKRRWITQKSVDNKPAIISISTDSLKNLIPEVIPVPLSDIKMDVSPEIEVLSEQEVPEPERKRKLSEQNSEVIDNPKPRRKVTVTNTPHEPHHQKPDDEEKTTPVTNKNSAPPSPAKQTQSNILYITNLVRPFTVLQLKGLLARTGKIVENGFWIDKIKSRCYVKYENEDEAVETRHALHGVRWPASNPKCLNVDFGREKDMEKAIISTLDEGARQAAAAEVTKESSGFGWSKADAYRTEFEEKASRDTHRPVREWDLGKRDEKENDENRRNKDDRRRRDRERDRERERERRRSRDRSGSDRRERRRTRSPSGGRKPRKTDNEPPIRLLDDLFRKTKSTPCIYWLPLTIEQIAEREELRRKRIEEQERQLEEMRKAREERQKERERERMRRKSRSLSRNKDRRRRTRSRSNSRSRSRSRDNRRRFNR